MVTITILVPSYGRASKLERTLLNIETVTKVSHQTLFIIEESDEASATELDRLEADWIFNERSKNYAGAINTGYMMSTSKYVFMGSDDLCFHADWDVLALDKMSSEVRVVGTHDLLNPYVYQGTHATHYLVDRLYIDKMGGVIDQPPGIALPEIYDHGFTDCEFIDTAKSREVFSPCLQSVVEHLHHLIGKSTLDATYEKGASQMMEDHNLFKARESLWTTQPDNRPLV